MQDMRPWALLLQLGWTISLSIVGSLLLGIWIDRTFGTPPAGILFFSLFGIIIGSVAVYRQVVKAISTIETRHYRKADAQEADESKESHDTAGCGTAELDKVGKLDKGGEECP